MQHVVLRATWYEGTAQLLSLTELKSHLLELLLLLLLFFFFVCLFGLFLFFFGGGGGGTTTIMLIYVCSSKTKSKGNFRAVIRG